MTDRERFAVLSWARDTAMDIDLDKALRDGYHLEEADEYIKKPKSEWPCGVLILMGIHNTEHPECPKEQDWRD